LHPHPGQPSGYGADGDHPPAIGEIIADLSRCQLSTGEHLKDGVSDRPASVVAPVPLRHAVSVPLAHPLDLVIAQPLWTVVAELGDGIGAASGA